MSDYLPLTILKKKETSSSSLVFNGPAHHFREEEFLKIITDKEIIEVTYEILGKNATYAQFAKVHANIRAIANYTGHSPTEVKKYLKHKAGLTSVPWDVWSFKDCSREDLSLAIQETLILGDYHGLNLHG